jgi:diacylglycerol kinase family enzyme
LVVGGDGTLLEVLNGLDLRRQTVALIATGRGNSLARDLGLYPAEQGFAALTAGRSLAIDLMEVSFQDSGGRLRRVVSASTVSAGYPASVAQSARNGFRRFGKYSYALAAAFQRPAAIGITITGGPPQRLTGFVANSTRHMANFVALPDANCRDGLFEILELRAGYLGQAAHNLSALSGLGLYQPVTPRQSRAVSVELNSPELLMIDGELYEGITGFEVRMMAAWVNFQAGVEACVPAGL